MVLLLVCNLLSYFIHFLYLYLNCFCIYNSVPIRSSAEFHWLTMAVLMDGGRTHTAATCSDNKSPFNQLASITFTFITHHQQHVQTTKTHVILSLSQFEERYWMGNVTSYHVLVLTYFAIIRSLAELRGGDRGIPWRENCFLHLILSGGQKFDDCQYLEIYIQILCCAHSCWKKVSMRKAHLPIPSSPTDIVCHLYIVYVCIYVHIFM